MVVTRHIIKQRRSSRRRRVRMCDALDLRTLSARRNANAARRGTPPPRVGQTYSVAPTMDDDAAAGDVAEVLLRQLLPTDFVVLAACDDALDPGGSLRDAKRSPVDPKRSWHGCAPRKGLKGTQFTPTTIRKRNATKPARHYATLIVSAQPQALRR